MNRTTNQKKQQCVMGSRPMHRGSRPSSWKGSQTLTMVAAVEEEVVAGPVREATGAVGRGGQTGSSPGIPRGGKSGNSLGSKVM